MSAATLTLLVLTLTGQVVELRSEKPFVTAEESTRVEVRVLDEAGRPLTAQDVQLSTTVGTVTQPALEQDGVWRATYQPPAREEPQVALFHAAVRQGEAWVVGWLSLPVHGRHVLRVKAPPRSRVQVAVGEATFGPVTADARGEASVPVRVPPGLTTARVTVTSRARRVSTQTVPLPSAASARLRLVTPEQQPVGGQPVLLEGFVVDEAGRPAVPLPPLAVSVKEGQLGPIQPREEGVFEVAYTAPPRAEAPVDVSVASLDAPEQPAVTLRLEPRPAPAPAPVSDTRVAPTEGTADASPDTAPGEAGLVRWQPSVGLFLVAQSNTVDSNGLGARLEGALRLAGLPLEALVQLEARRNEEERQDYSLPGKAPVEKVFQLGGFGARLGARFSQPVWGRGLLSGEASLGVLRMAGTVRLEGLEGASEQQVASLGPVLALGAGLGWALGPGRVCAQAQWALAPGSDTVQGNLGGLSLSLGYQLPLGGGAGR